MSEQQDSLPQQDNEHSEATKAVADFTLAELLRAFFRQPRATSEAFRDVIRSDDIDESAHLLQVDTASNTETGIRGWVASAQGQRGGLGRVVAENVLGAVTGTRLVGYTVAFMFVLFGNIILSGGEAARRSEDVQLAQGFPFIVIGFLIWSVTEFYFALPELKTWWINRRSPKQAQTGNIEDENYQTSIPFYLEIPLSRWFLALAATILSGITWLGTANNTFSTLTFYIWLFSILCWSLTFAPYDFNVLIWARKTKQKLSNIQWRKYSLVMVALAVILGMGFYFRFHQLDEHPREMTDDHVEKILDSGRVRDGDRNIFFANNGGREPLQMYLIALVSHLPGLGINHDTIKFVSAIESFLTIPALFWMGYALLEGESKRRRLLVALILAALAAASYWHVAITRQGLRIPLTPLVVSLNLIYLARAIRHNRRGDFIITGLILGFGLYMYQAVRMLPVVIVVAVAVAIVFNAKTMRQRLRYVVNLTVLVAISFTVFLPMFRYSVDFPELFWRRTTGRLLGDDVIQEVRDDGTIIYRDATAQERFDAFVGNIPTIASNVRNVLLMFNWEGDVATISGVSTEPAMDTLSAALLVVGLAAWVAFAIRRRDTIYWLIPLITFIMLMPSALSIAFPGENPSHTRTSGAIPTIYLLSAFPLALFVEQVLDNFKRWRGQVTAAVVCVAIIGGSFQANTYLYFEVYPERYEASFNPYSDAGRYLYGYILTGGSYGNAYLIGYEHWWSHRAVGLEGGLEEFWENGIFPYENGEYSVNPIIRAIYVSMDATGLSQFRANSDLLFFLSPDDEDSFVALQTLFPTGTLSERPTYKPNETFMVYEVPTLGSDGLQAWIIDHPYP